MKEGKRKAGAKAGNKLKRKDKCRKIIYLFIYSSLNGVSNYILSEIAI
jgi:hypothetical protein